MSVRSRDVPSKSSPRMVLWRYKWARGPAALGEGVPALFLATLRRTRFPLAILVGFLWLGSLQRQSRILKQFGGMPHLRCYVVSV